MHKMTTTGATLRFCLLSSGLLFGGCYSPAIHATAISFRPDPVPQEEEELRVGRDCSFHFGGLTWRELDVRQAARHALEGSAATTLNHFSSQLVYPAPFEICLEVQGVTPS